MIPTNPAPFQSASLYVGDLHPDVNEGLLFEIFSRVGPVASIRVCRDAVTRRSLGYAYVNFHNVQDAERALDTMNFTDIKNKQCRIMWSQRDPTLRKTGVGNVFIKNLALSIDNKSLFDTFSVFGNILSCKVITDDNGASKGYGYVHYETGEAAQDAIKKLDGCQIEGQTVSVQLYTRKQDRAGQNEWTNLYMKQMPLSWNEENLKEMFGKHGPTTSIVIQRDAEGKSKGFGFINFENHEGAEGAVNELNGKVVEVDGQSFTLYVGQAQKKADRVRELKRQIEAAKHDKIMKLQGMNLYVKNLDDTITDDQLREMFSPYGTITSARIMKDDNSGVSKGFGFVCFSSPEEAGKAIAEMNNKVFHNKPVTVTLHQRKEQRRVQLAATVGARQMMGGRGNGYGPQGQFMMGGYQGRGRGGYSPRGQFNGRGGMQPQGPAGQAYPIPNYTMQTPGGAGRGMPGMRPPQQGFNNMMQQGGRGPAGAGRGNVPGRGGPGRGPMGMQQQGRGPMGMPAGGVKFNTQARNQPNMPPPHMMMPPMGMQNPNMPQMHMPPHPMMGQPQGPPQGMPQQMEPLNEMLLAHSDPQIQKHLIGERLYPLIMQHQPQQAGKITGMLLEMDNAELLHLIESPDALQSKIEEAIDVLRKHQAAMDQA